MSGYTDEEYKTVLRRALVDCNYKWPKELTSGVMFYLGRKITIEEFRKEAKLFK